jgi:hypothetical protein
VGSSAQPDTGTAESCPLGGVNILAASCSMCSVGAALHNGGQMGSSA